MKMLSRSGRSLLLKYRNYSALVEPSVKFDNFRTKEEDVKNHSFEHIGKFYRLNPEIKKQLFANGGFPKLFEKQVKTFGESCLMIRQPAIEIINYINKSDLSKPAVRYVLYGENGTGKSLSLAHVIHYGLENNFLLIHVPWAPNWFKRPKDKSSSTSQEGFTDLPFDAAQWLVHFKTQNAKLLPSLNLKLSRDYVWSKRETTPAGASLSELVEHGIQRVKFASDVIGALLYEVKQHSTAGRCKTMVAIDGYNAFFYPKTRLLDEHKVIITPDKVTLTKPFLDITKYDWCNGVCILVTDKIALTEEKQESYYPRYLLGKDGFEHLDPFVPIHVTDFTNKEYYSCIGYYLDRKWIQNCEEGFDEELKFLSSCNPYLLMKLCAPL